MVPTKMVGTNFICNYRYVTLQVKMKKSKKGKKNSQVVFGSMKIRGGSEL